MKIENKEQAIEMFEKVVELESKGHEIKWLILLVSLSFNNIIGNIYCRRFKALQELVILYYAFNKVTEMVDNFKKMLSYISHVTRNECTDAINNVLDTISSVKDLNALSQMYELTLAALKNANNERLWFNTNLKLSRVYLESKRFNDVDRIVTELKKSCQLANGEDDPNKGTSLLEVYCLEIQLCTLTQQRVRMKGIYPKTLNLNSAVADPRIMGVIREEGGKMHMSEGNWDEAYNELYEAFRSYQEAGNSHAKTCLKYVVLASMLALSDINPFAAPEAKVFSEDKEIIAMSNLRQSLEANDLEKFEKILAEKSNRILDEPFIMTYVHPLRRRMKEQVLINITKPYKKVTLLFLSHELSLNEEEVELLLVDMILDNRLVASIDQVTGHVFLSESQTTTSDLTMNAINKWTNTLSNITENFVNRTI